MCDFRPLGQAAKTTPSHGVIMGSIPVGVTSGRLPLPIFGGVQPFLFSVPRGGGRGFPECSPMAGCRSRFSGVCSLFCFLSREGEVGGTLSDSPPQQKNPNDFAERKRSDLLFYFFVSLPRRRGRRATGEGQTALPPIPPSKRPSPKGHQTALGARQTAFERASNGNQQTAFEKTVTT